MTRNTVTFIEDLCWDIRIKGSIGKEIRRQVSDILAGVTEPVFSVDKEKARIIVGSDEIDTDKLGPDDHIVRSIDSNIHIAGKTDKASAYGVFSFLEELGFYFLASETIIPSDGAQTAVPYIDKVYETDNSWRGMFLSFCMVSTSIMSVCDFETLLDNMLRMKMNRIIFYSFENEPIIDYSYKGERKLVGDISRAESGYFSYGRNWTGSFHTEEIEVGGEKFNRKKVAPMEFQDVEDSDSALDTGRIFMNDIINAAKQRLIGVWISFLPQFVSMNMTKYIKPMPRKNLHWSALVSCTDDAVKAVNSSRIISIIESYPDIEGLFIGIPEGFYDDPYPKSREYIESVFPDFEEALRLESKYWGDHWPGKKLQVSHIRADIAFSKIAVDTITEARRLFPNIKLGILTVCKAYLLTKLHSDLPLDISFCDIESRSLWTHGGAPLFLFRRMNKRECSIIPRITDDGSQAGMQFNLNLYHSDGYCRSSEENGTVGLMMQTLHIKGADHNIKYLAEGLWNPKIEPDGFYKNYIIRKFGIYSKSLAKAFDILEKNEIHMGGRGAANMPWNHVPPEIAAMRILQKAENPWHECPLSASCISGALNRLEIYKKSILMLDEAAVLFNNAAEAGADINECRYMSIRTKAYARHLAALVEIIGMYSNWFDYSTGGLNIGILLKLKEKAEKARELAFESAELFASCITHVTDLAILWMVNSSMVKGTNVLFKYMDNILKFHKGEEYWANPGWESLFGECPYPAYNVNINDSNGEIFEPG